jgi:hypothetical protein
VLLRLTELLGKSARLLSEKSSSYWLITQLTLGCTKRTKGILLLQFDYCAGQLATDASDSARQIQRCAVLISAVRFASSISNSSPCALVRVIVSALEQPEGFFRAQWRHAGEILDSEPA